jgi:hypothetical protein
MTVERRKQAIKYNQLKECIKPIKALFELGGVPIFDIVVSQLGYIGFTYSNYGMSADRLTQRLLDALKAELEDLQAEKEAVDEYYFKKQEERFNKHTAQIRLFDIAPKQETEQLQIN